MVRSSSRAGMPKGFSEPLCTWRPMGLSRVMSQCRFCFGIYGVEVRFAEFETLILCCCFDNRVTRRAERAAIVVIIIIIIIIIIAVMIVITIVMVITIIVVVAFVMAIPMVLGNVLEMLRFKLQGFLLSKGVWFCPCCWAAFKELTLNSHNDYQILLTHIMVT